MGSLIKAYQNVLQRRPFITSAVSSFTLFAAGDVIAQQLVEKNGIKGHDWVRTARLGLYGGLIFTPVVLPWYRVIDRVSFASKPASIAAKVVLDQFLFAPFAVGLFFTSTTLMEGKTLDDVKAKLDKSYVSTVKANWMLFVPFQTINMGFVPLQHRLLAVNVISLFWNTYLSLASAAGTEPPKQSIEKKGEEIKVVV
ncbi:Protein required for ethanol metabolism [Tulasnella sp. 424]|nr:Protein required for ethanol metabolism [Tulasnella sp. 424]KAG8974850.1 Protein required for ethanol metabolism [Tulasnella sp. 425]